MDKLLNEKFFNQDTSLVAQELLGKFLVRNINGKEIALIITETEAYDGPNDKASHTSKGKTERTKVMFGKPGIFYVYLCYGMHYMLNIVTREKEYPAAVLIRGVVAQNSSIVLNGPGKVTKFLKIDKNLNTQKAEKKSGLWFEDRGMQQGKIQKTPRIGVAYAGPLWASKKLRFMIQNV